MKRRQAIVSVLAGGVAMAGGAIGQEQFMEGRDFKRLDRPQGMRQLPDGKKIELVEFFWYGCPACNAFEPSLDAWAARLAPDVAFRKIPVGFGPVHQFHQKLYFALERLPDGRGLHKRVFAAIHVQRRRLDSLRAAMEWAKESGVSEELLAAELNSMRVDSAVRQAKMLCDAYRVDSVPSLGVQGRFITSPSMTKSYGRTFGVAEMLMTEVRAKG